MSCRRFLNTSQAAGISIPTRKQMLLTHPTASEFHRAVLSANPQGGPGRYSTSVLRIRIVLALLVGLALGRATAHQVVQADEPSLPKTSAELFELTKIWNIELTFSPEQFAAMEPKQNSSGRRFGGIGRAGTGGSFLQGALGKRNGIASAMGVEFEYVHGELEFEGVPIYDVAVRYKGNGTFLEARGIFKRSFKIDLNDFVSDQKLAGQSQLNLHNGVTDPTLMNEVLAHRLYRDAGVPAPRTAYAKVYVNVIGKHDHRYFGLYSVVEDIGGEYLRRQYGENRGALFKPVLPSLFDDLGDDWNVYLQAYDPKGKISVDDQNRVIEFSRLVTKGEDAEFARRLPEFVDLDSFARYMAVTTWLADMDGILGPGQNYYLHLGSNDRKFSFIAWDQDHSFGQFGMRGTPEQRENLSIDHPWQGGNRFLDRVYAIPEFQKLYREYFKKFSETIFEPTRLAKQVDELAKVIRPAIEEESKAKLARFESAVEGKPISTGGFFGQKLKPIKPFAEVRTKSVTEQLEGVSQGKRLD